MISNSWALVIRALASSPILIPRLAFHSGKIYIYFIDKYPKMKVKSAEQTTSDPVGFTFLMFIKWCSRNKTR